MINPMFKLMQLPSCTKRRPEFDESWVWGEHLQTALLENSECKEKDFKAAAVPVRSFANHLMVDFIEDVIKEDFVIEYEVEEYRKALESPMRAYWLATVQKVAGYRALCRWAGVTESNGCNHDFWVNLASEGVYKVGTAEKDTNRFYCPPSFVIQWWKNNRMEEEEMTVKSLEKIKDFQTLNDQVVAFKSNLPKMCRLQIGQRLEVLDTLNSWRLRPATVIDAYGRRVFLRVGGDDCPITEDEEKNLEFDKQRNEYLSFWVDQASFYLFPVGWAACNGYGLHASAKYTFHTSEIAEALEQNKIPVYDTHDVTPDLLYSIKKQKMYVNNFVKGSKLEILDPLEAENQSLFLATVVEVLKDGYLKILRDNEAENNEEECIPLHCTSPLLFPLGYHRKYNIDLRPPEGIADFDWDTHVRTIETAAAPKQWFKKRPTPERLEEFQIGAKIELADLNENKEIGPGTIKAKKGRMLHIGFDGWEAEFDQLVDIDSYDIFPLGWCEMNGCKLDWPKNKRQSFEEKQAEAALQEEAENGFDEMDFEDEEMEYEPSEDEDGN